LRALLQLSGRLGRFSLELLDLLLLLAITVVLPCFLGVERSLEHAV
jgi:hypothetical protein